MTAIRLPVSFALALCTTVTLFWFLGVLTAVEPALIRIDAIGPIQFSRHVPDTDTITITRPPKLQFEKPEETPVAPVIQIDPHEDALDGDSEHPVFPGFGPGDGEAILPRGDPKRFSAEGGSDRGPVPQVRIDPTYPPHARDRGVEGWITFRFTVTASGSVKDIEILDSDPPRIWDSATVRAVSTWKYQPALKDGKPVAQAGVTATYRFEIDR